MAVTVKVPTILRSHVGGRPTVEGDGQTVRDLIEDLERRYPGIKQSLVTKDGGLHRFVNVYLNDEDVRYLGSLETQVSEGDTISILPAVAGG
jgi:sulfur-carrier protein